MARDPVCGMNVQEEKNNKISSEFKGQNYYFCSDKCRQEFDRNPSNFARDKENQSQNTGEKPNENESRNRNENRDDRKPR
ncbi:MAG: YHS domain-containing protein [Bacillota bacterium]